jgi:hypothetical protein
MPTQTPTDTPDRADSIGSSEPGTATTSRWEAAAITSRAIRRASRTSALPVTIATGPRTGRSSTAATWPSGTDAPEPHTTAATAAEADDAPSTGPSRRSSTCRSRPRRPTTTSRAAAATSARADTTPTSPTGTTTRTRSTPTTSSTRPGSERRTSGERTTTATTLTPERPPSGTSPLRTPSSTPRCPAGSPAPSRPHSGAPRSSGSSWLIAFRAWPSPGMTRTCSPPPEPERSGCSGSRSSTRDSPWRRSSSRCRARRPSSQASVIHSPFHPPDRIRGDPHRGRRTRGGAGDTERTTAASDPWPPVRQAVALRASHQAISRCRRRSELSAPLALLPRAREGLQQP